MRRLLKYVLFLRNLVLEGHLPFNLSIESNCEIYSILAECEKLMELYERLEELDADKASMRASRILHGLGFTTSMQQKKLKDFSGGWRMRVALAR